MNSMTPLIPCQSCSRHIRADHASCPFCSTEVPSGFVKRAIPGAKKRLDRLAYFTFATTLVVSACGEVEDPAGNGNGSDAAVASDAKADGGTPDAKAGDGGTVVFDGGPNDDGGMQAAYGIPIDASAFDVNTNEDGGAQPPYGLPPIDGGSSD